MVAKDFYIEVKSGSKMNLPQSQKNQQYANSLLRDYVLYMPKATSAQIKEGKKLGIKVIRDEKQLSSILRNKGK